MNVCEPASALAAVSDDDVMACVKTGSMVALSVLYDRYCDRAYRVAWSVCRDAGRAEEAVQEAFISIWKTRMTYVAGAGKVAAWVLTVVRYRAIDIARRNGPHAAHRASDDILRTVRAPDSVAAQVATRAEARDVLSLLAALPDAQREVITLAFYGQLTHSEIAAHLALPLGTVKGRMRLGLQRLRWQMNRVTD
jgi:RNA polymerase sigma-70 factor (ECF subfamily)